MQRKQFATTFDTLKFATRKISSKDFTEKTCEKNGNRGCQNTTLLATTFSPVLNFFHVENCLRFGNKSEGARYGE